MTNGNEVLLSIPIIVIRSVTRQSTSLQQLHAAMPFGVNKLQVAHRWRVLCQLIISIPPYIVTLSVVLT